MKALLLVLIVAAVGLGVLALRKESTVHVHTTSAEVVLDGLQPRSVTVRDEGTIVVKLKPYAEAGFVLASAAVVVLLIVLRKRRTVTPPRALE